MHSTRCEVIFLPCLELLVLWTRVLGEVLPSVLTCFRPDIVLYDAGVDTHMHDSLGKLNLTDKGLQRRELQVCQAPLLSTPAGIYQQQCMLCRAVHVAVSTVYDLCEYWAAEAGSLMSQDG